MKDTEQDKTQFEGVGSFIISLGEVPRNPLLVGQLNDYGLDPLIIRATDGRFWEFPFKPEVVNIDRFVAILGRIPSGPEIGCALSHLRVARDACEMDIEYCMVFEEDAFVSGDLIQAVEVIRKIDSSTPTIVQLFSLSPPLFEPGSIVSLGPNSPIVGGRFLLPPASTVAYILNRAAIRAFASRPVVEGVADWPPYANSFDFWGLQPWPVSHLSEDSAIEQHRKILVHGKEVRNRYRRFLTNYMLLFRIERVKHHSNSLGGLTQYASRVIVPESRTILHRIGQFLKQR